MDCWTRSVKRNSLESIGVAYDERDTGSGELTRYVQVATPERALPSNQDRDRNSFTDDLTTTDTTGFTSLSRQVSGLTMHQRNGGSLGFTFSGTPADVVCFRSCISYHMHRPSRKVVAAEQSGPFAADVLCIILLYIAVDMREILQVSHTCRYWRFYANYAPHWTYYRRLDWSKRIKDLPNYIRRVVVKPKIVTQEEYFRERSKVQAEQRRNEIMSTALHVRWCVAVAVLCAAACATNFAVAYFLGFLPTVSRSDTTLGGVMFALMVTMVVLEVTIVIIPLGGARSPSEKQNMMRLLSWGLFLLLTACIFGTVSALAMRRVQSSGDVIDGTVLDFTMDSECCAIDVHSDPSFALLPAQLTDIRWRPITMDDSERVFRPYCISHNNNTMCYVFLYFDAYYESKVFNNASAVATKDIGTRTALGFDPIGNGTGGWCAAVDRPQVIALIESVYVRVREQLNRIYSDAAYTSPTLCPNTTSSISYLCSMDHARVKMEDTPGSTQMWYKYGQSWRRYYIPLLTDITESRETFREEHNHYLHYAYICYIIAFILWFVMLIAQCLAQRQAVVVLGVATTVTLALMNPIIMILAGVLCVNMSDRYFICNASTGGSLLGGGVFITAFLVAIYVCFF
ncbi:hypothetical protein TraAM80_01266 [Trypanosoma rangeli]|uniref:F-box domain-containing protein n=1 Tax=Trypanosoma rangeli TaxID=5698 RepID=A0A3R7N0K0_TRYRA|nr:uncharacterized protein TraAM80_01266 [Trypanosoma rangeli]RNF10882.1 hypothetical protein TraAM80_01266 [Trypanosoma rangeli]|eukprot:RNF10882.1 hypothetical protein TraAM80_01266 [Trypanosoma rangeli]